MKTTDDGKELHNLAALLRKRLEAAEGLLPDDPKMPQEIVALETDCNVLTNGLLVMRPYTTAQPTTTQNEAEMFSIQKELRDRIDTLRNKSRKAT